MKTQYIRQVKRRLHLPRKVAAEVVRDLNEIFASAAAHGETDRQVIERLGPPEEFASQTAAQFGFDHSARRRQNGFFLGTASLAAAVLTFGVYAAAKPGMPPAGAIGQADAMTNIQIEGASGLNVLPLLPFLGALALAFSLFLFVKTARRDRRTQ